MSNGDKSMRLSRIYYKIAFYNQGSVYEISARYVSESQLFGFLEVSDLVFESEDSSLETKLSSEFEGVRTTYVPTHAVIRIDEVEDKKAGSRTLEDEDTESNVSHFPINSEKKKQDKE